MKTIRQKITSKIDNMVNNVQAPATKSKTDPTIDSIVQSEIKATQTETIAQKVVKFHKLKILSDKVEKELKELNQGIKDHYQDEVAPDNPLQERFGSYLLHLYASGGKEVIKESIDEEAFEAAHPRIAKSYQRALEVRQGFIKQDKSISKVVVSMKVSNDGSPYTVDDLLDKL